MVVSRKWPPHSVTTVFASIILLSWMVLSYLADQSGLTVPQYLVSRGPVGNFAIVFLSPIIHQKLQYVMGNLLVLLAIGPLVEDRLGSRIYAEYSIGVGIGLSVLALMLEAPTVGYSGVTYALVGRELVGSSVDFTGGAGSVARVLLVIFVLYWQLTTIAIDGASLISHVGGLSIGVATALLLQGGFSIRGYLLRT